MPATSYCITLCGPVSPLSAPEGDCLGSARHKHLPSGQHMPGPHGVRSGGVALAAAPALPCPGAAPLAGTRPRTRPPPLPAPPVCGALAAMFPTPRMLIALMVSVPAALAPAVTAPAAAPAFAEASLVTADIASLVDASPHAAAKARRATCPQTKSRNFERARSQSICNSRVPCAYRTY